MQQQNGKIVYEIQAKKNVPDTNKKLRVANKNVRVPVYIFYQLIESKTLKLKNVIRQCDNSYKHWHAIYISILE